MSRCPSGWAPPGFGLGLAGTLGIIVCVALFVVRGRATPAIFDAPQRFVAVGPYKYVRNPMYLSGAATFVGFGLSVRSLAVLAFAGAWFLLIHAFVVFFEEPGLRRRFGGTYEAYLHRVPRWIPKVTAAVESESSVGVWCRSLVAEFANSPAHQLTNSLLP
jgi:protein-S-isoprenylcysteine O-methyltransferase Ste14